MMSDIVNKAFALLVTEEQTYRQELGREERLQRQAETTRIPCVDKHVYRVGPGDPPGAWAFLTRSISLSPSRPIRSTQCNLAQLTPGLRGLHGTHADRATNRETASGGGLPGRPSSSAGHATPAELDRVGRQVFQRTY
jgi:hypothetical protein